MILNFFRVVVLVLLSQCASAGVLLLSNGDRISGELIIIANGEVRWQSDMAGEIAVPQVNVVGIEARDLFEVELDARRLLSECQLQLRGDNQQLLNCKEGVAQLSSWKLVQRVSARPLISHDVWRNTGSISAAAKDSAGNTNEQDLELDFRMSARRQSMRHTVLAKYAEQRQLGIKTQDDRKLEYQFDYFVSDKWFLNSVASLERNVFQDLSSRTLLGGGIGYQFFDTELLQLSVDSGFSYVEEIYANDRDRRGVAFRENANFTYRLSSLGLQFFHRDTFLQLFDRAGDWRINTETGFKIPVVGRLNAQAKLRFDYVHIPADDAKSLDRVWLFGVNYDW